MLKWSFRGLAGVHVRQCKCVLDRAKIPEDEWSTNMKTLQTNTRRLAHASLHGSTQGLAGV
jgi:hypothetical protein